MFANLKNYRYRTELRITHCFEPSYYSRVISVIRDKPTLTIIKQLLLKRKKLLFKRLEKIYRRIII